MVASVIMVILVGLVIQITTQVLNVWNESSGKLSANAEARIALDLLTQDLETAVFRNNGLRWLEAEQVNLGDPFEESSSFKTTELKLFSPALDRPEGPGDICGISYLLKYSDPIDGSDSGEDRTFILYRNVIDPQATFEDLLGTGNQEGFTKSQWSDVETIDGGDNYLASNIVDFRIDFYLADEDGTKVEGDTLFGGKTPGPAGDSTATVGRTAITEKYRFPLSYAEITLMIISEEAMSVIQNDAVAQSGYASDEDYVAANAEVFTRRVNFLAQPL
jgi:hypothetical protein